jgi:hypothetical protein
MSDFKTPDCGDNSCYYLTPERRGGMRTNGGCQCFSAAGFDRSATTSAIKMLPELLSLRSQLAAVTAERDAEARVVDDFILASEHLPECEYSRAENSSKLFPRVCHCMDRAYYNQEDCLKRARARVAERGGV